MGKYLITGLIFIAIIITTFSISNKNNAPTEVVDIATSTTPIKSYTLTEVSMHPDINNCWTTINSNVYDITSYVSKHPGGESNILKICGKDGTSLFEGQHGGDSRPEKILSTMFIGKLIQ